MSNIKKRLIMFSVVLLFEIFQCGNIKLRERDVMMLVLVNIYLYVSIRVTQCVTGSLVLE